MPAKMRPPGCYIMPANQSKVHHNMASNGI